MEITIQELNPQNVCYANTFDGTCYIDSRLCLNAENGQISYTINPAPGYTKPYLYDAIDYTTYIDDLDKTIFFAFTDGQAAGQIILRKNWNRYAYIEDIVVDARRRKQGIGEALLSRAIQWAKSKNLPGIMLETQNDRVSACRLYARCGFQLGGFDSLLYKGINPDSQEIALFWYLIFR